MNNILIKEDGRVDLGLKNKVSLVSGSSRGIGKAIACGLLKEGAIVYITGRNKEMLDSAYNDFKSQFGGRVYKFSGDLTNTDTIENLLNDILNKHNRLDIVVANIGSGRFKSGWDVEDELWMKSFDINFFSSVKLSREAIRVMIPQKSGNIVFISSIAGCEAIPAPVEYSSAKSALLSYVKNTSNLVASMGIRLNAVSPGNIYFEGGTWDIKLNENKEVVEKYIKESVPLQRLGRAEEISDAVCFLSSDRTSFVTGANFVVDGGQIKRIF